VIGKEGRIEVSRMPVATVAAAAPFIVIAGGFGRVQAGKTPDIGVITPSTGLAANGGGK
jgi:hypothetical protein